MTLASGGESNAPACGPPVASPSSAVTPAGSVHKCAWMLQRGHSGDGCVLATTLCKFDLRK